MEEPASLQAAMQALPEANSGLNMITSIQDDAGGRTTSSVGPRPDSEQMKNRPWSKHRLSRTRSHKHHHHHHRSVTVTCHDGSKVVINQAWLKEWLVDLEHMDAGLHIPDLDALIEEIHTTDMLDPDVVHELLMCLPAREAMRFKTMAATTMNAGTTTESALNHEYIDFAVEHTFQRLQAQAEGRWVDTPVGFGSRSMPASRQAADAPEPQKPVFHFLLNQFDEQIEAAKKIQRAFRAFKARCDQKGWPSGAPPAHFAKTAANTKARYLEVFNRSKQPVKDRKQLKEVFAAKLFDKMKARAMKSNTTTQNGAATEPVQQLTEEQMLAMAEAQAERLAKQAERDRRAAAKLAARQARVIAREIAREERREALREQKRQAREKVLQGKVARAQLRKIASLKTQLEQAVLAGTLGSDPVAQQTPLEARTVTEPSTESDTAESGRQGETGETMDAEATSAAQLAPEAAQGADDASTSHQTEATAGVSEDSELAITTDAPGEAEALSSDGAIEDGHQQEESSAQEQADEVAGSPKPGPRPGGLSVIIPQEATAIPDPNASAPVSNPWNEATMECFKSMGLISAQALLDRLAQDANQQLLALRPQNAGLRSGFTSRAVSVGGYLTDQKGGGSPAGAPASPTKTSPNRSPLRGRPGSEVAFSSPYHRGRSVSAVPNEPDLATSEEKAARRADLQRLATEFAPYMSGDEGWSGSEVSMSSSESSSSSSSSSSYASSSGSDFGTPRSGRKSRRHQNEMPSGPCVIQKLDLQAEIDPLKKAIMVGQGMLSKDLYRNLGRGEVATPSPRLAAQRKVWETDGGTPVPEGTSSRSGAAQDGAESDASETVETAVEKGSGAKAVVGMLSSLQQEATPTQPMHKSGLNMLHHILFRDGLELIGSMVMNDAASRQAVLKAKVDAMVSQKMDQVRRELGLKTRRSNVGGGSRRARRSQTSIPDSSTQASREHTPPVDSSPGAVQSAPLEDGPVSDGEDIKDGTADEVEEAGVDAGDREVLKELIASALAEELATKPEAASDSAQEPAAPSTADDAALQEGGPETATGALTLGQALGLDVGTDVQQIEAKIVAAIEDAHATAATMAAMKRQQRRAEERRAKRRTRKADRLLQIAKDGPSEASDDGSLAKSQASTRNRSTLNYLHPASYSQMPTATGTPPVERGTKPIKSTLRVARDPDQAKLMTEQMVQLQRQAMRLANRQVTIQPPPPAEAETSSSNLSVALPQDSPLPQLQPDYGHVSSPSAASPVSKAGMPVNATSSTSAHAPAGPHTTQWPQPQAHVTAASPLGYRTLPPGFQGYDFSGGEHPAQSSAPSSSADLSAPGSPVNALGVPGSARGSSPDLTTPPEAVSRRKQYVRDREYDYALARELFLRHARQHRVMQPGGQAAVRPIRSMGEAADYLAAVQLAEARAWGPPPPLQPSQLSINLRTAQVHSAVFQNVASNWSRQPTDDGRDGKALAAGIGLALEAALRSPAAPAPATNRSHDLDKSNTTTGAPVHASSAAQTGPPEQSGGEQRHLAGGPVAVKDSNEAGQLPALAVGKPADSQAAHQRHHRRKHRNTRRRDANETPAVEGQPAAVAEDHGGERVDGDRLHRKRRHRRHHPKPEQRAGADPAPPAPAEESSSKLPLLAQPSHDRSRSAMGSQRAHTTSAGSIQSWLESSESFLRKNSRRNHQTLPSAGSEASSALLPMLQKPTQSSKKKLQDLDAYYHDMLAGLSAVPPQPQPEQQPLNPLNSLGVSRHYAWERHTKGDMVNAIAVASFVPLARTTN